MKSVRNSFLVAFVVILAFVNIIHYWNVQSNLVTNQEEKVELLVKNVRSALNTTNQNERFFNEFLADSLRTSAKAVQYSLPPKIEDVTNEQLVELTEQLSLEGITLFVKEGDDVVSVKSSDPDEIGLSTKGWVEGKWYKMFNALLTKHDVDVMPGFGEALPNFWAGPINTSTSNPNLVTKWGYYNDGTTDYLINTYVEEEVITGYYETAGVQKVIADVIEDHPYILTITVLNAEALEFGEKRVKETGAVRFTDRLLLAGDYIFQTDSDEQNALKAIYSNQLVHYETNYKDKKLLKSYFPSDFKAGDDMTDKILITVTSDFEFIQSELYGRLLKALLISGLSLLVGLIAVGIVGRFIDRKRQTLDSVQGMYEDHIESIFETIGEFRHDFNHHLHTISGLAKMGLTTELHEYVSNLVKVQDEFSNIVNASVPALSGLVQSKKVEAREKEIEFEYHFENMESLDMPVEKLTDIVKVIGNILDNAFHAVEESQQRKKNVSIYGRYKNDCLKFTISNNGDMIPIEILTDIFKMGFTTRSSIGGTGVGLASCKKAIERYRGDIHVESTAYQTVFNVSVPIGKKEIRLLTALKSLKKTELNTN